jgi:hypothetical protein
MNSDFRELLRLFNVHKVRYLVVGGYAVMNYTESRRAVGRPQDLIDVNSLVESERTNRGLSEPEPKKPRSKRRRRDSGQQ